jgi:hypothetical protein
MFRREQIMIYIYNQQLRPTPTWVFCYLAFPYLNCKIPVSIKVKVIPWKKTRTNSSYNYTLIQGQRIRMCSFTMDTGIIQNVGSIQQ